jgi:5-methylcytosine-specific restriction protein A
MIFLFTGESGHTYGYKDGFQADGTFWYTGEGQVGDMQMIRGNVAIQTHVDEGRTLHLFEQAGRGTVKYLGEASYTGHHIEAAPDKTGNPRKAIIFELALSGETGAAEKLEVRRPEPKEDSGLWKMPTDRLRNLALSPAPKNSTPAQRKINVHKRARAVRIYVLRRARGLCEGCEHEAPFSTAKGRPYLEPHHIRRVSDGGPDHPRWVAALCPNCHARVHYGKDGNEFNHQIAERVGQLEPPSGD